MSPARRAQAARKTQAKLASGPRHVRRTVVTALPGRWVRPRWARRSWVWAVGRWTYHVTWDPCLHHWWALRYDTRVPGSAPVMVGRAASVTAMKRRCEDDWSRVGRGRTWTTGKPSPNRVDDGWPRRKTLTGRYEVEVEPGRWVSRQRASQIRARAELDRLRPPVQ